MTEQKSPTDVTPYAFEYGRSNGDGTYSVVIERGEPKSPVPDWPVKPLYDTPAPAVPSPEGEWIVWEGGKCPVPSGTGVEIKLRDGDQFSDVAGVGGAVALDWKHDGSDRDIIAYRIAK